jgi:hypothetical protein
MLVTTGSLLVALAPLLVALEAIWTALALGQRGAMADLAERVKTKGP